MDTRAESIVLCTNVNSTLIRWCQAFVRANVHQHDRSTCTAAAMLCTPGAHNFHSGAHHPCQTVSDLGDRLSVWLQKILSRVVWQPTPSQRGGGRPPPWPAPRMRVHMYT